MVPALASVVSGVLLVAWVSWVLASDLPWLLAGYAGAALVLVGVWLVAGRARPRPVSGLACALAGGIVLAVAFAPASLTLAVLASQLSVILGLAVAAAGFARAAVEARTVTDDQPPAAD